MMTPGVMGGAGASPGRHSAAPCSRDEEYVLEPVRPEVLRPYGLPAPTVKTVKESWVRLATPEKALPDTLYLVSARSRLFAHLPEVELPRGFNRREARRWLAGIPAGPRRTMVTRRLNRILATPSPT